MFWWHNANTSIAKYGNEIGQKIKIVKVVCKYIGQKLKTSWICSFWYPWVNL